MMESLRQGTAMNEPVSDEGSLMGHLIVPNGKSGIVQKPTWGGPLATSESKRRDSLFFAKKQLFHLVKCLFF